MKKQATGLGECVYGQGGQGRPLCLVMKVCLYYESPDSQGLFLPWSTNQACDRHEPPPGAGLLYTHKCPDQASAQSGKHTSLGVNTSSGSSGDQVSSLPEAPGLASGDPSLLLESHSPEVTARTLGLIRSPRGGPWRGPPPLQPGL